MPIEVEEGKTYFWYDCGKSAKQPFCDGSHVDTGIALAEITAVQPVIPMVATHHAAHNFPVHTSY